MAAMFSSSLQMETLKLGEQSIKLCVNYKFKVMVSCDKKPINGNLQ